jgi:3-phenylpropionate/cinnamic acid dioxygenase small subunit
VTLDELVAREALRELVAAYAHLADAGRLDAMLALFADDGVLRIDERPPLVGRDAIRAFLGGTRADVRATARTRPLIRHNVSNLRLTVDGPDAAHGDAYFLVVTDRGTDHWGRYRDRYVRVGDAWRFAERHVRVDGMAPGSWAAERRARQAAERSGG